MRHILSRTDPDPFAGMDVAWLVAGLGVRTTPGSADAFRDEIRRDLERNGPIIKAARITVE